ncbi:MAG: alpha/beta fold hydrolase, partial [Pseudomonadota bacterium]
MRSDFARSQALKDHFPPQSRDIWAQRWLKLSPFDEEAARTAVDMRHASAGADAARVLAHELRQSFADAELSLPDAFGFEGGETAPANAQTAEDTPDQNIRFVETNDNVSIAWASVGDQDNPPLVKAANWLNHLELDWEAPIWSPLFRDLASAFHLIRYDERGCGLSDWNCDDLSFESFVTDLEQVVEAAGLTRFPLLGISQGAAVSIEFAARHPEKVSQLILFGAYDCGWRHTASDEEAREREAVMVLTEKGWGSDN